MNNKNPDNPPAFPRIAYGRDAGMSMRKWYKGKVMQGLLSALNGTIISPEDQKRLTVICGGLADAMLIEDEQHKT